MTAALTLSPYLRDVTALDPTILEDAIREPLVPMLDGLVKAARSAWRTDAGGTVPEAELMTRLRRTRRKLSYLVAMADLARLFDARDTTRWLSAMADACVAATIDHLLVQAHESGKVSLVDVQNPSTRAG